MAHGSRTVKVSIRHRMLAWLVAVLLPIVIAASAATQLVSDQISERIDSDLSNIRRLEAARIDEALEGYERQAESLASGRHIGFFTDAVLTARETPSDGQLIEGTETVDDIDPNADRPLDQLTEYLRAKLLGAGGAVLDLQILGPEGDVLGRSPGYSWEPYEADLAKMVFSIGTPRFGNAFRTDGGSERLGLAVLIETELGEPVGVLMVETKLGPIADFVIQHEGFGETREAHIAQPTPAGDAELITLLRFDRDAAFELVVPSDRGLPINESLTAGRGRIIDAKDYRGNESILALQTIERTGWGLVVKIDRAEALAPVSDVRRIIGIAAALVIAAVLIGWAVLVRPSVRRLRLASAAAARVAAGGNDPIADPSTDEIGDLSRVIDDLSRELAADQHERAEAEAQLQHRATHDELTGLFNRVHAAALLTSLTVAHPWAARTSLLFLDLDNFKSINDSYGHQVGDEILVGAASRIAAELPESATLARWGGDEFVVILPGTEETRAAVVAEQVRQLFDQSFPTSTGPQSLSVSLGAATMDYGDSLDEVLAEADRRMFDDKSDRSAGRTAVSKLRREVNAALATDKIAVHYQPLVAVRDTGEHVTVGVEALVRVRDGDRSWPPQGFLDTAENCRLGALLDRRVHEQAMGTFAAWRRAGVIEPGVFLSVNLTEASSSDHNLAQELRCLALANELSPSDIVLEISERSSKLDPATIASLREAGFPLALDDFGTRYANVDRLVDLQPDIVKLDRRWLGDRHRAPNAHERRRLERLVRLARDIDATVVLEGVETDRQRVFVNEIDADYLQGFVFSAPLDDVEAEQWLRQTAALKTPL